MKVQKNPERIIRGVGDFFYTRFQQTRLGLGRCQPQQYTLSSNDPLKYLLKKLFLV
ncbi:MAG: hypothetical protein PVI82_16310 [Desulfobacterales bacterium]|jgi:hypothetical protein